MSGPPVPGPAPRPAAAAPAAPPAAAAAAPGGAAAPAVRVLVAEDEALIRLDLVEMLQQEGYLVVGECGDGASAVRLAGELRPDVVLLDVRMPVLDGLSAAEQIMASRLSAVVVLTAFSQRDLVARAREAGVLAYVVKPFQGKDLVPAIEMAVSRFAELVALEREVEDLAGRLEARTLVDRAKSVLLQRGMSEPEAFRWIQRRSMDERVSMRSIAEELLAGTREPDGDGEQVTTSQRP